MAPRSPFSGRGSLLEHAIAQSRLGSRRGRSELAAWLNRVEHCIGNAWPMDRWVPLIFNGIPLIVFSTSRASVDIVSLVCTVFFKLSERAPSSGSWTFPSEKRKYFP